MYLASPIEDNDNLWEEDGEYNWGSTVYAIEIGQFMDAGYTLDGDYMIPPPLTP